MLPARKLRDDDGFGCTNSGDAEHRDSQPKVIVPGWKKITTDPAMAASAPTSARTLNRSIVWAHRQQQREQRARRQDDRGDARRDILHRPVEAPRFSAQRGLQP
jgi:hypothetical protein